MSNSFDSVGNDRHRQMEELEVIQSMYQQEFKSIQTIDETTSHQPNNPYTCIFSVQLADFLQCEFKLPFNYPSAAHPVVKLNFISTEASSVASTSHRTAFLPTSLTPSVPSYESVIEKMYIDVPCEDEVVVFQYIEYLKDHVVEVETARRLRRAEDEEEERQRIHRVQFGAVDESADTPDSNEGNARVAHFEDDAAVTSASATGTIPIQSYVIHSGTPFTDRKSTFQAHLAVVHTVEDTKAVLAQLYSHNKIARATHNMWAYVLKDPSTGIARRDCDDDGEAQAGSRMAHLLHVMDVSNLMVVVSRWYGGIQLGADRFKHINNVTRDAIEEHQHRTRLNGTHHSTNEAPTGGDQANKNKTKSSSQRAHKR